MKKALLSVIILFALISVAYTQDKQVDTFPPGFGKEKTYLYVVTVPGYFQPNNALKKVMEKNYTGDYEVIDIREFDKNARKPNVHNYSFAMIYDGQDGYFSAGGRVGPETNYSCGVTDMATGKLYRLPYVGGNYKKVMEKYIKRLEEIRKQNEEAR